MIFQGRKNLNHPKNIICFNPIHIMGTTLCIVYVPSNNVGIRGQHLVELAVKH